MPQTKNNYKIFNARRKSVAGRIWLSDNPLGEIMLHLTGNNQEIYQNNSAKLWQEIKRENERWKRLKPAFVGTNSIYQNECITQDKLTLSNGTNSRENLKRMARNSQ